MSGKCGQFGNGCKGGGNIPIDNIDINVKCKAMTKTGKSCPNFKKLDADGYCYTHLNYKIILFNEKSGNYSYCKSCKTSKHKDDFSNSENMCFAMCSLCRNKNMTRNRTQERKEYNKMCDRTEKRKESKRIWTKNNYDKVKKYRETYKKKDIEQYNKRCSDRMKEYRKLNPEYVKKCSNRNNVNPEYKYNEYKRASIGRNLEFNIDYTLAYELFIGECHYCGAKDINRFSGIDRKDNSKGYTRDNVVSCCTMCNMIKKIMDIDALYYKIKHILTNKNYMNGDRYDDYFHCNNTAKTYNTYKSSAIRRKKEFNLTEEQYYQIYLFRYIEHFLVFSRTYNIQ